MWVIAVGVFLFAVAVIWLLTSSRPPAVATAASRPVQKVAQELIEDADRRAGQAAAAAQAALTARQYAPSQLAPRMTAARCVDGVSELSPDGTRCLALCRPGETVSADGERCLRPCPISEAVQPYDDARCISGTTFFDVPSQLQTYKDGASTHYRIVPDAAAAETSGWVREGDQYCRALLPTGKYATSNVCTQPGVQKYSAVELDGTGPQSRSPTDPRLFAAKYTFLRPSYRR